MFSAQESMSKIIAVLLPDPLAMALSREPLEPILYGYFGSEDELRDAMIADPMITGFKEVAPAPDSNLVRLKLANGEDRKLAYRWE
jgi:hypothetical protein